MHTDRRQRVFGWAIRHSVVVAAAILVVLTAWLLLWPLDTMHVNIAAPDSVRIPVMNTTLPAGSVIISGASVAHMDVAHAADAAGKITRLEDLDHKITTTEVVRGQTITSTALDEYVELPVVVTQVAQDEQLWPANTRLRTVPLKELGTDVHSLILSRDSLVNGTKIARQNIQPGQPIRQEQVADGVVLYAPNRFIPAHSSVNASDFSPTLVAADQVTQDVLIGLSELAPTGQRTTAQVPLPRGHPVTRTQVKTE